MTTENLTFQQRSLVQQGYRDLDARQLAQLDWGLRFTPVVCSLLTLVGLVRQSYSLLFLVSLLGIWAFLAPAAHPMDLLYNHLVRHLFHAVKLPPNPFQRRLACLAAGVMNATAASLLLAGQPALARVVGAVLLVLQMIVITTHFCALSWIYDLVVKALGSMEGPIELTEARRLLQEGAILMDVREPNEFARGHLKGAMNYPLTSLEKHVGDLRGKVCLLYCASGMRSQMAAKKLKSLGEVAYNLGGMSRCGNLEARSSL